MYDFISNSRLVINEINYRTIILNIGYKSSFYVAVKFGFLRFLVVIGLIRVTLLIVIQKKIIMLRMLNMKPMINTIKKGEK